MYQTNEKNRDNVNSVSVENDQLTVAKLGSGSLSNNADGINAKIA